MANAIPVLPACHHILHFSSKLLEQMLLSKIYDVIQI